MFATTFTDVQLFGASYAEPENTSSIRDDYGFNLNYERPPSPQPVSYHHPYCYYANSDPYRDNEHTSTTSIYLSTPSLPPTKAVIATKSSFNTPIYVTANNMISVGAGTNLGDSSSGIVNQAYNPLSSSTDVQFVFESPPNLPPTSPTAPSFNIDSIDDELTFILTDPIFSQPDMNPQLNAQTSPSPYSSAASTPMSSVPQTPTSPAYPFSPFGDLLPNSSNVPVNPPNMPSYNPPTPTTLPYIPSTTLHPNFPPNPPKKFHPHSQQTKQAHPQPNHHTSNTNAQPTTNHANPTTTTSNGSLKNSNGSVQINVRTTTNSFNRFSVGFNKEFNNTREFSFVNCNPDPNNKKRRGDNSDRVNFLEQEIKDLKETVKELLGFLSTFANSTRQCPSCSAVISNSPASTIMNGYYNNNGSNGVSPRRPMPNPDFQQGPMSHPGPYGGR